ncbi:MAG: hypothetical protein CMM08_05155 [Rhodospirillaceae bacterium]|nr:hypothetical protein [Rhodospirillaceae bacterium]
MTMKMAYFGADSVMNSVKFLASARRMAAPTAISLAAFAVFAAGVRPALADSLEDATEKAVRTHPTVMAARAFKDSAGENVGQARAGFFPTVDFRGTSGYARTNNSTTRGTGGHSQASAFMWRGESSLTFSQLLWDGWGTSNGVEAAEARVDVSRHQVLNAGEQIGLRAVSSYLDLDRNRELVRLAGENVTIHEKLVKDVKLKAESGGGNEADVNQAEARLALAGATVDQFKGTLRDAEAAYLEAIGERPGDTVRPPVPAPEALPADVDSAVKVAMVNSPTVNTAVANVGAMKKELASVRAALMPRLSLDLGGVRNENAGGVKGPNNDFTAQLVLTYNLFRGGGDAARIRSTSALLREATLRELEARRTVEATTRFSYHALITARDRLPTLRDHVSASDKVVKAFTEQFKLGKRSLLDLLDVEGELFQAKGALVNGEVALMVAHYRVLATMGELRQSMGIESAAVGGTDAATLVADASPATATERETEKVAAAKEAAAEKAAEAKAVEEEAAKIAEAKAAEVKAAKEAEAKAAEEAAAKVAKAKAAEVKAAKEAEAKAAEEAAAKVAEEKAAEVKAAKEAAEQEAAQAKAAEAEPAETKSAEARIVPPPELLAREAAETAKREEELRLAVEREADQKAEAERQAAKAAEVERKAEAKRKVAEAERKAAEAERKAAAAAEAERQAAAAAAAAAQARNKKAAEAAAAMKKAAAAQARAKQSEIAAATPKRAFSKVPQDEALEAGLDAYMARDYRVAMDYWLPQARADDANAQFLVGGLYHDGAGVMADPVAAYFWWALAAHKGHGKAESMLAALVTEMRPDQVAEARRLRRDWQPIN